MIKINKKNKALNKVFEFLSIYSLAFGLVVGAGIYLKNRSEKNSGGVLEAANQNPYLAIAIWTFVAIVATLMMLSFIEISSGIKSDEHNTMMSWVSKFINRRAASVTAIFYVSFYMPIIAALGSMFTVEVFFSYGLDPFLATTGSTPVSESLSYEAFSVLKIFLATIILVGFQTMNLYSKKPGHIIQTALTFLKFLPLIIVIIGGFVVHFSTSEGWGGKNSFDMYTEHNQWAFSSIFATVVPIIFAFDGFVHAATLQKDVENKKVVSPALLIAIISVGAFYIIITIAIFIGASNGNIFQLIDKLFVKAPWASFLVKIMITFTVITLVNGYTGVLPNALESSANEGLMYFGKGSKDITRKRIIFLSYLIILSVFFLSIALSFAMGPIRETGKSSGDFMYISDTLTGATVVYAFVFYIMLMIGQVLNRVKNKVEVRKVKGGFVTTIVALVILGLIMPYVYYVMFIFPFTQKLGVTPDSDLNIINGRITSVLWLLQFIVIAVIYFVNEELLKKQSNLENSNKKSTENLVK
ncbi:hypothetical protein SHELI_v1c11270 [Spiroplasma helicoides]|uniref:Amino acid permease n=1 Tax=Spiroplasma helicoides TaxID=216938 RepID=A0A1B3SMB7_9MOLU|nr:amino acid permease [Spiroplasma helicoides]AOG61074.1 hypothetical protein SHELI_v1c11270 [Spiroplasma helicoides]